MALTKITATNIGANAVTANNIGYVPANKAGDTFTGAIAAPGVSSTGGMNINGSTFEAALRMTNTGAGGQDYYLFSTMNSFTQGGGKFMVYNAGNGHPYDWAIDSAGRVTAPYQPSWCVEYYGMTVPANTSYNYTGGTVFINNGSYYSTSTGRFTAPVAGYYLVSASIEQSSTTSTSGSVTIMKNGAGQNQALAYGATYNTGSATAIVYCAVNDYITIMSYGNNGISYNVYTTRFTGHLIG